MEMLNGYDIIVILRFGNNLDTKREDAMRSEKEFDIRDYSYYSYGVNVIKIVAIVGLVLGLMVFFIGAAKAEAKKTLEIDYTKIGWSSQLIYDTTNGCFQGTLRWIVMANPALIGRTPPPPVQRAILEHCFCVLDRLRNQYNIVEYFQLSSQPEEVMGQLYLSTALMCVQNNGTLQGIITINESTDNSTVIPEKQEDSEESLSDQPEEESPNEDTKPIFQG
jgi:hypothetical protein